MSKFKNCLMAATAMLVACGQVAPEGGTADAKATHGTDHKLDIAGVSIGMSAAQATAVLKSGGWNVKEEKGNDWSQEVNNELARQNVSGRHLDVYPKGVGALEATKGEERL